MSRQPFTSVTGTAAPLLRPNIDTDVIIRVERMTSTSPADLAAWAFEALRYRPDGTPDPGFVLNEPRYTGAPILLAGPNFGCGSSREPAVWAIMGLGIRCVIAPSFGDIFKANCLTNGLLPVTLGEAPVRRLATAAARGTPVTVNLETQRVTTGNATWPFTISPSQKTALLDGLDDLELALRSSDDITRWEERDRRQRPWAWTRGTEHQP
jgi:3-isopropylmalate/(R)-2-methylmalate dehydratase small subunit